MARDPFAGYDAWLERPIQERYAEGERWEAAQEGYANTDDYWSDFLAWLGAVPLSEYNLDDSLATLIQRWEDTDDCRSKVQAWIDAQDPGHDGPDEDEPADWDLGLP